jgi:hypothetical protein
LVNVLDLSGNAVRDLTKDNFHVKVNKQPVAVLSADYTVGPRRIVVLLDMSGSMGANIDTKKWQIARDAVEDLFTQTPTDIPIAFLTFSDQVHDVFDFRESRVAISRWFDGGPTQRTDLKGRTALRDAILAGVKMLQPFRAGDAIYAITDGGDNSSHVSLDQAKATLRDSGARLFAFLFAEHTPLGEEVLSGGSLSEMARDSGGFVFGIPGGGALAQLSGWVSQDYYDYNERTREKIRLFTRALNIQVNGFYTVQVAAPVQRGKVGKISMEIVDSTGKPRKDVGFTYQRRLSPALPRTN